MDLPDLPVVARQLLPRRPLPQRCHALHLGGSRAGFPSRRVRRDSIRLVSDGEKRMAAEAAAELVEDGMRVGLGTGSTVAFLLPALARRGLDLRCVATSPATERAATALGLRVEPFDRSTGSTSRSTAPTRSRRTAGW